MCCRKSMLFIYNMRVHIYSYIEKSQFEAMSWYVLLIPSRAMYLSSSSSLPFQIAQTHLYTHDGVRSSPHIVGVKICAITVRWNDSWIRYNTIHICMLCEYNIAMAQSERAFKRWFVQQTYMSLMRDLLINVHYWHLMQHMLHRYKLRNLINWTGNARLDVRVCIYVGKRRLVYFVVHSDIYSIRERHNNERKCYVYWLRHTFRQVIVYFNIQLNFEELFCFIRMRWRYCAYIDTP